MIKYRESDKLKKERKKYYLCFSDILITKKGGFQSSKIIGVLNKKLDSITLSNVGLMAFFAVRSSINNTTVSSKKNI